MVWVVITRNQALALNKDTELERRKCPLIDCERPFKDPEAMFQHVHSCLLLSKGLYRCFKCSKEESVGRYHTNICPEQSKDRFGNLSNPIRLAKRFLSRHALKRSAQPLQPSVEPQVGHAELLSDPFYPLSELDANYLDGLEVWDGPAELSGIGLPPSLGPSDDLMWMSPRVDIERILPPELSGGFDSTPTSIAAVGPLYAAAELEAPAHSMTTSGLARQASILSRGHELPHNDEHQWHVQEPTLPRPLQLDTYGVYQRLHHEPHEPQMESAPDTYHETNVDGGISPMTPTANGHLYSNTVSPSPIESSAGTEELSPPGLSSLSSTPNTSMSSFDSNTSSMESYQPSFIPVFGRYGSDILSLEPEELDSTPILGIEKAPTTNYQFHWPPTPGNFVLGKDTIPPAPLFAACPQRFTSPNTAKSSQVTPLPPPGTTNSHPAKFSQPRYKCICGYEPSGLEANKKKNFTRHQETACKRRPGGKPKFWCNYYYCGKSYPRRDNLLAHQRKQNHHGSVNLEVRVKARALPLSEPDWGTFEMDEVRPLKRRRTE